MAVKIDFKPVIDFEPLQDPRAVEPNLSEAPANLSRLGKAGIGFSVGMAESLNPLSIPHGLEVLGRAALGETADPKKGFFGRVSERLSKADKHAVIPNVGVDDIAAGTRTVARVAMNPASFLNAPKIFEEEKKSQEDFNKNYLPEGSKKVGEVTGGLLSLGLLAKDVASLANIGGKAGGLAESTAFQSLRPIKGVAQRIQDEGRAQIIGRQLLDDKIIGPGTSWKTMLARTEDKLDEYGQIIGHYADTADKAVARDSSIRGVLVDDLIGTIENNVVPKLIEDGKSDVARSVLNWATDNLKAAGPTGELGYRQTNKILKTLRETKAKFDATRDTPTSEAFQDIYRLLNEQRVNGIEAALQKGGSVEEIGTFLKAKDSYRNLSDVSKILEKTVAGKTSNRWPSLTDYKAGGTGGIMGTVIGAAAGGPVGGGIGGAVGLSATIANKIARERGSQASAFILNKLSKIGNGGVKVPDAEAIGAFNFFMNSMTDKPIEFEPSVVTPRKKN